MAAQLHTKTTFANNTEILLQQKWCTEQVLSYQLTKELNFLTKTFFKKTPLHIASRNGYLAVVKYLVEHRAETTAKDDYEVKFY